MLENDFRAAKEERYQCREKGEWGEQSPNEKGGETLTANIQTFNEKTSRKRHFLLFSTEGPSGVAERKGEGGDSGV